MTTTARRLARKIASKAGRELVKRRIPTTPRSDLIRLGSDYGGWWVPSGLLNANSVCYLAGLGEDATFDLALIETFGCHVWAMDPTPRAIAYSATLTSPNFHFHPVGLWGSETTLDFYAPVDPEHVSHSAINAQDTATIAFSARCTTVRSLMAAWGHSGVDLLKLDIEGAEVEVLQDLMADGPLPRILCVELDAPEAPRRTLRRLRDLMALGYVCHMIEDRNYTFVREALAD